jgi:hypothetical protein
MKNLKRVTRRNRLNKRRAFSRKLKRLVRRLNRIKIGRERPLWYQRVYEETGG